MHEAASDELRNIKTFPQLVKYLRDELDWPIKSDDFDDLTFEYAPDELGLDAQTAVKVKEIKQLRPLTTGQPWGIFFVSFEPKRLPVVALRRILSHLVVKKRQSANKSDRPAWQLHDLLFISSYGESEHRDISFAQFAEDPTAPSDLPVLRVLGWDDEDTVLHLDHTHKTLKEKLRWPGDAADVPAWRRSWSSAFVLKLGYVARTSKELSVQMAALAARIRKRVNKALAVESDKGPLKSLMAAFKAALIHDLKPDDFADMYAQTITYGLLSARVSRPAGLIAENVVDMVPDTNPFLKELLSTFLTIGGRKGKIDFDELGLNDVVQALRDADMTAILRDFNDRNPQEDPVIHFYELFLKEYDAKNRMKRGVFYTPKPVVSYIVRSVHELLQTEFGLADGLADTTTWAEMLLKHKDLKLPEIEVVDPKTHKLSKKPLALSTPFVQILDPATGTATFLVEVIDVIHKTMLAKWKKQGHTEMFDIPRLWNEYVPKHLLPRLHGYELMMAPYAIAHMKIGLKLFETGYKFGSGERARIYLTNALEPPQDFSDTFEQMAPALAHEAEAVNDVKRHQRFTVVIGNPPYAGHSANVSKDGDGNLTFIGRLIEDYKSGCPELFKPAQAKWLHDDYVKFLRFDQWLIAQAGTGTVGVITNHGYIDNPTFRGMRRDLKSLFAQLRIVDLHGSSKKKEKSPDGNAEENVFDIQQGVAILLATTRTAVPVRRGVFHADIWGPRESKYARLLSQPPSAMNVTWSAASSSEPQYVFEPQDERVKAEYEHGWRVPDIFDLNGDPAPGMVTTHDEFAVAFTEHEMVEKVEAILSTRSEAEARKRFRLCTQAQWNYAAAKRELRNGEWRRQIVPLLYRPFDPRWTVFNRYVAVHRRERVMRHMLMPGNLGLVTARSNRSPDMDHFFCSRQATETKCGESTIQSYLLPLYLAPTPSGEEDVLDLASGRRANLSRGWLDNVSSAVGQPAASLSPEACFNFIYAVLYSPVYRTRYAEFLKTDFPRISIPGNLELFRELGRIGGELVSLHVMEAPLLENPLTVYTGPVEPEVEKVSYAGGTVWLDKKQKIGFAGVPEAVWNFHIGGYQVCEKWLKDRKGRRLIADDIAHYQKIVVALNETIRLMKEIDQTIEKHGGWPGAFVTTGIPPA